MATPGFSGFGGGCCWVFSHFQVSSILLGPDALVLGGPTTPHLLQSVCQLVFFFFFTPFSVSQIWDFSHFQVSSILLGPDALVLGGPATPQCVWLFVRLSGCLFLFLFYFSHHFILFSEFGFSLISKSAALPSRDQMPLFWVVPPLFNVFACVSACQGIFLFSFSCTFFSSVFRILVSPFPNVGW